MVVEQKVTSMTPLKIKSCLLGSILNNFQKGLGEENPVVSFYECAPRNQGIVFLNILTYKPKKFMKQKRQQIDHIVAQRGPFPRFQFYF